MAFNGKPHNCICANIGCNVTFYRRHSEVMLKNYCSSECHTQDMTALCESGRITLILNEVRKRTLPFKSLVELKQLMGIMNEKEEGEVYYLVSFNN